MTWRLHIHECGYACPGCGALEVARELDRALRVQEARTLRQRVVVPRLRGVLQDGLHQVRLERRIRLQHQRDRAGHDRRGHAGAAQAQIRPVRRAAAAAREQVRRLGQVERARRIGERHDAGAGRDEVGLGHEVDGRGTARAVRRDLVVPARERALGAVGTHRQHPGRVARGRDAAVLRLLLVVDRLLPQVAGGGDDDDAGVDRALGREGQRIGFIRLGDACAHRQVDDADVVRHAVGDGPLEGGDDVADDAAAVLIEHLQADQVRRRRDARVRAVRVVAVAGDDAGDVRPVAVVVVGLQAIVDEVDKARHALAVDHPDVARVALIAQVVVPARDTRVDDRHADAGAVIAPLLLRRAGADRYGRAVVVPRNRTIEVDAQHFRALGDLLDDPVRELDGHAVDEPQPAAEPAAELPDFLFGIGFLPRLDRDDHLGGAKQPARAGPRFLVELLEPLLPAGVLARARLARPFLARRARLGGHRDRERDESREHECPGLPRELTLSRTH